MNNNKGQMGILNFWTGILVFLLVWGIWLGKFIAEWCHNAIIENNISGIDAFMLSYMNLWIFIMLLIVCAFAYFLMGGGQ